MLQQQLSVHHQLHHLCCIGYYNKNDVIAVRVQGKALDNRAAVFVSVDTARGYKTAVGFTFNKYTGGVRGTYGDNKGCAAVFYKTPTAEKVSEWF